jgi:uncharacterized damage-inducible protein DinB
MSLNQSFIAELQHEAAITRKFFERYPADKGDYAPHAKSMKMNRLASHVAELITWVGVTLDNDELDFAKMDYKPNIANNSEELIAMLDKNVNDAIECLNRTEDAVFMQNWTMRHGEKVYFTMPKIAVLRSFVCNHLIHHRAQLGVYYRMLDVPVPGSFGPTADEPNM